MAVAIMQEITIELDGNAPFEYVVVKQNETDSRQIKVTLLQNKQIYTIPSGVTAQIKYYKPDGKLILNNATIASDRKSITVTYTKQMLAAAGTGLGEIVLNSGTSVLRSATYCTKIVPTVYEENGLISDSEFLSLAETIIALNQATDKALNAAVIATAATSNANTATSAANTAADNANTATSNANTATSAANTAKNNADTATGKANTATSNANTATAAAKEATTAANAATEELKATLTTITNATQAANVAAAAAEKASTSATASAKACDGIAVGINSMTDTVDGKTYSLGVHGGIIEATEI